MLNMNYADKVYQDYILDLLVHIFYFIFKKAFLGVLLQAIAFFLLIIAGIQLKSVLEKLKTDADAMINFQDAGGYS